MNRNELIAIEAETLFNTDRWERNHCLMSSTVIGHKEGFTVQIAGGEITEEKINFYLKEIRNFLSSKGLFISGQYGQHIHKDDAWNNTVKHFIEYNFLID